MHDMESLYKRKKLDFSNSIKECTTCTYTQNIFQTEANGRIVPTPPLLIQNKHLKRSSSDSEMGDASPHYHYPHSMNHISEVSRERTYMSDKITTKSPHKEKLWSGDMSISEPPLLIKSCSAEHSRPTESNHRKDKLPQKCITPASMSDKYRHPIFATTEDIKKDYTHKWDKHLKPYGLDHTQYMQCVSSRKNGGYLNPFCSKSMLNKNIYIDCGRTVEVVNGDKNSYKVRNHEKGPYEEMHQETIYSINRQHSSECSLLSTTSLKSQSIISTTSRDGSPPDDIKSSDNNKTRQLITQQHSASLINFRILERHEHYIVVYAEINGKRYEGCLTIQRKST